MAKNRGFLKIFAGEAVSIIQEEELPEEQQASSRRLPKGEGFPKAIPSALVFRPSRPDAKAVVRYQD